MNYYTNIHWLNKLYHRQLVLDDDVFNIQEKIYIEGIGTENNKADSLVGMGLGNNDTGVIAKTDSAISLLRETLAKIIVDLKDAKLVIAVYSLTYLALVVGRQPHGTLLIAYLNVIPY